MKNEIDAACRVSDESDWEGDFTFLFERVAELGFVEDFVYLDNKGDALEGYNVLDLLNF